MLKAVPEPVVVIAPIVPFGFTNEICVLAFVDSFPVIIDPANRHYAAILEWAEEDGNTIQEAD